jgi:hypothetical protein
MSWSSVVSLSIVISVLLTVNGGWPRSCLLPSTSPVMPSNRGRRGGYAKRTKRAADPRPRIRGGRLLLKRQRADVEVDRGRPCHRFPAEDDPAGADAKPRQFDPEHVRILVVIRMQDKASVQRGYRAQGSENELTTSHYDFGPGADGEPRRIGYVGRESVPTAEVCPDFGVVWNIGSDPRVGYAK